MAMSSADEFPPEEASRRVALAREAQAQWRRYSLAQRVKALRQWWSVLEAARERLVEVVRGETGKPLAEIETMEFEAARLIAKHFTRNAHRLLQDQPVARPWVFLNKRAYVRYVPRGIIGLITQESLPFLSPFGDALPALLAGNAVLLKPAERGVKTAFFMEERFRTSGLFPEGLLQVFAGSDEAGKAVARSVDMVLFTGSVENGREVAKIAAERLISAVLGLNGKHAMIVAKDAPLARTVKAAIWGGFSYGGQLRVSVRKIFVEEPLYAAFVEALGKEAARLRQGLEPGYEVELGRLCGVEKLAEMERLLEDARAHGARVVGGEVIDREKLLVSPALVLGARPEMAVMREEAGAPIVAVMPVSRVDEAVLLVSADRCGLAASVWTLDLARGERLCALLEAGLVSVNELSIHYVMGSLPFGGFKESGLGRLHADEGLRMFCQAQSVLIHEWPAEQPSLWWFPYSRLKSRILAFLARLA